MSDEYNATERSDIRIAQAAAKVADRQDDEVLRETMRTVPGRAWMFRLLAACHIHQTTFTGDALISAFKEGERNIGLMLENSLMRVAADEYILMMREAHGRTVTDTVRRNRSRANNADDAVGDTSNFVDYGVTGDAAVERDAD